jgi:hypothetical protein
VVDAGTTQREAVQQQGLRQLAQYGRHIGGFRVTNVERWAH